MELLFCKVSVHVKTFTLGFNYLTQTCSKMLEILTNKSVYKKDFKDVGGAGGAAVITFHKFIRGVFQKQIKE